LIALSDAVARDVATDGCAARRDATALQERAHALVGSGRVPAALRAQLLAGVAAVVRESPACAPRPTPAQVPAAKHEPKHPTPPKHPKPKPHGRPKPEKPPKHCKKH